MPQIKTKKQTLSLDDLREQLQKLKEEGEKLVSHQRKLFEYYSDWEDRFLTLENEISAKEDETGLTRQEIVEYNPMDDVFS